MKAAQVSDVLTSVPGPAPLPVPETLPYWEGARRRELWIPRDIESGEWVFATHAFLNAQAGLRYHWEQVGGQGVLESYVINHRQELRGEQSTAVVIAVVRLDEGVRLMSNLVGVVTDPAGLPLGLRLRVAFVAKGEWMIPVFEPAEAGYA